MPTCLNDADRGLFAFVAEPAKPQALNKMTLSAMARGDDKSNRTQSACDEVACGSKKK